MNHEMHSTNKKRKTLLAVPSKHTPDSHPLSLAGVTSGYSEG
jgi:hypothetical protein